MELEATRGFVLGVVRSVDCRVNKDVDDQVVDILWWGAIELEVGQGLDIKTILGTGILE